MSHFVIKRHAPGKIEVYAGTSYNASVYNNTTGVIPLYCEFSRDKQCQIMLFPTMESATEVLKLLEEFDLAHTFVIYNIQDLYGDIQ